MGGLLGDRLIRKYDITIPVGGEWICPNNSVCSEFSVSSPGNTSSIYGGYITSNGTIYKRYQESENISTSDSALIFTISMSGSSYLKIRNNYTKEYRACIVLISPF